MNKHVKALLIKFIASFALLYIILGLVYEMTFGEVLLLSAALGIAAYVIGDMLILPRTNNTVATIADFILSGLIIYLFADGMTAADNVFTITLIATIAVSLFEIFFHRYLENNVLSADNNNPSNRELRYQTEISDELGPDPLEEYEKLNR